MKISKWLVAGVLTLSFVLGYTVGVSSSPVASVIIPSLFTLVTIATGLVIRKDVTTENIFNISKIFGIILLGLSVTYFGGSIVGANIRVSGLFVLDGEQKKFPWAEQSAPKDIRVAIDWIGVQEKLLSRGYRKEEISKLYKSSETYELNTHGILMEPQWLSDILPWGSKNKSSVGGVEEPPTVVDNYNPSKHDGRI